MTSEVRKSVLLTGATGLLGRYLIRDLASQDVPLAVLARPNRKQSAHDRVASICHFWKVKYGIDVPAPKVLVGNIIDDRLGMSDEDAAWANDNVDAMLHNAASLSFVSTGRQSEPWRSNIDGTRTVLNFCDEAGIRKFFHVSTAYVAGQRRGRIMENELNEGQEFGNCYEESKLMAEEMVQTAHDEGKFDIHTVFRPGIILGDSQTGFTSTFHHVYSAIQMSHVLAGQMGRWDFTGRANAANVRIPMRGNERKHLVPVDWVSEVMSYIIARPEHHGQTYHLTPRCPMRMRLLRDMIEQAVGYYGIVMGIPEPGTPATSEAERLFMEQQELYSSYWNDDPTFDSTNTRNAAPHLPCPHLDRDMLVHFAEVAMEMNFKFSDPKLPSKEANSSKASAI